MIESRPVIGFFTNKESVLHMYDTVLLDLSQSMVIKDSSVRRDYGVIETDLFDVIFVRCNDFVSQLGKRRDLIIVDGLRPSEEEYIDNVKPITCWNNGYCIKYEDFIENKHITKYTYPMSKFHMRLDRKFKGELKINGWRSCGDEYWSIFEGEGC